MTDVQHDPRSQGETDPKWFTLADVLQLEKKLSAYPQISDFLLDQNDYLTRNNKRQLTLKEVALIGCLFRKNIRQNKTDPGGVPQSSATTFSGRSELAPSGDFDNRQVRAAINVLEAVGFMIHTRKADKAAGQCAAYKLLNEAFWESPSLPPLNGNPDSN